MTHEIEQAARKFVHQAMGTALDKITLLPREDRLRIKVPEGNFHIAQVMQTLKPRLDDRYHISLGRHYVELFEPPGQAERDVQSIRRDSSPQVDGSFVRTPKSGFYARLFYFSRKSLISLFNP